ncbi:MAG TPA: hypothetical protein PK530_20230 [Anaerolineales bacterium]|nr:hypothetical protein [Anaerolineales bacterium]
MTDTPEIDSFIIRFVHSHPEETSAHLRGSIRHIQTNEEKAFTHWLEVEQFIKRFIPLDPPLSPPKES